MTEDVMTKKTVGRGTVESALADLRVLLQAFDEVMDAYFSDEFDGDEIHPWEHKLKAMRRVLLYQANSIVYVYGAANDSDLSMRARLLWEVHSETLEKYGIIRTEDGKLFTFKRDDEEEMQDAN